MVKLATTLSMVLALLAVASATYISGVPRPGRGRAPSRPPPRQNPDTEDCLDARNTHCPDIEAKCCIPEPIPADVGVCNGTIFECFHALENCGYFPGTRAPWEGAKHCPTYLDFVGDNFHGKSPDP